MQTQLLKLKGNQGSVQSTEVDEEAYEEADEHVNTCIHAITIEKDDWFLDIGTTLHVIGNKNLLREIGSSKMSIIRTIDGQIMLIAGKGKVKDQNTTNAIKEIKDVLYITRVKTNLFSVGKFTEIGQ